MTVYKMLQEYLQSHENLADRLQQPLKQVRVGGEAIFSSRRLPGGRGSDASELPENLSADWDPLWATSDELHGTRFFFPRCNLFGGEACSMTTPSYDLLCVCLLDVASYGANFCMRL